MTHTGLVTAFVSLLLFVLSHSAVLAQEPDTGLHPSGPQPSAPLIFIPGLMGSQLCDPAQDGKQIWGDEMEMEFSWAQVYTPRHRERLARLADAEAERLQVCDVLREKNATLLFEGYDISSLLGIESANYGALIRFLEGLGYRERDDAARERDDAARERDGTATRRLHVFPYDWRRSSLDAADALAAFIEDLGYEGQVDILAHSMGGLVATLYSQGHPDHRVRRLVTLGTPHQGAATLLTSTVEPNWWSLFARMPRQVVLTWPSLLELMPAYERCCYILTDQGEDGGVYERFDPYDLRYWQAQDWYDPTWSEPDSPVRQSYDASLARVGLIRDRLSQPVSVARVIHIASPVYATPELIRVGPDMTGFDGVLKGPGDDTVPFESATNDGVSSAQVLEASNRHMRIFTGSVTQANLRTALLDPTPQPHQIDRTVSIDLSEDLGERRARLYEGAASVEVNFMGVDLDGVVWAPGETARATMTVNYDMALSPGLRRLLDRHQDLRDRVMGRVRTHLQDRMQDADTSLCIDLQGDPVCLAFAGADHRQADNGTRTVSATFTATAPQTPGLYWLTVEQDILDIDLSRVVVVAEAPPAP